MKVLSGPGGPAPQRHPPQACQPHCSQAQLLPALEKVLGGHLRGLEEFVDGHWELQSEGLGSATVPEQMRNTQLSQTPSLKTLPCCPTPHKALLPTHRKRTDSSGGVKKSRRHSMLSTCCTCAPPSTCAATRLVCTASCGPIVKEARTVVEQQRLPGAAPAQGCWRL